MCLVSEINLSDIISVSKNYGAPTVRPEALPAVTVPLLLLMKQGLSLDMLSMLLPWRGYSSVFTSTGPEDDRPILRCMHTKDT